MSRIIGVILEIIGFLLIFSAISIPSFMTDRPSQAILGAVLIIYSLSRKVIAKLDVISLK